jgi:hypothetical protein
MKEMGDALLNKLLSKCLAKYFGDLSLSPLSSEESTELKKRIMRAVNNEPEEALYIIVEDIVYDFLTN